MFISLVEVLTSEKLGRWDASYTVHASMHFDLDWCVMERTTAGHYDLTYAEKPQYAMSTCSQPFSLLRLMTRMQPKYVWC